VASPSEPLNAKAEEYLEKGKRALAGGEHDYAVQYFRQLVKMEPAEEEYRKLLAHAELERAKSQVNVLTRPFYTLWAIVLVGILRMHKAGLKVTRILAKSKPGSKLAATLYATSCLKTKRAEEAALTYEAYLREKPFDEGILEKLSKLYYDRLDYVNAVRTLGALRKLRPEDQEIDKMYNTAVTQKYTAEGTDLKKLQRIDEERQKVEAKQPKIDERKLNLLIEQCKEQPEDVNLRIRLGRMLAKGQQWEQATGVFEAALEMAPDDVRIVEELAALYDQQGKTADADALLERMMQLRPDDRELKKKVLDRKIARGEQAGHKAAAAESQSPEALEELRQERLELEIAEYRQKIRDNPGNPDLYLQLGKLLRQKGELDEAIKNFQQAARNPTRAFLGGKLLGETFYEKGMLDIAAEQLIKAKERAASRRDFMTTDLKEIHYLLSQIYEELGDLDQSIEYLKPIYEEDINFRDVGQRFEQLYEKRRKSKPADEASSATSEE